MTALDKWSACCRDLYLTTLTTDRHPCPRRDSNPQSQQRSSHRPTSETTRPHWYHYIYIYFSWKLQSALYTWYGRTITRQVCEVRSKLCHVIIMQGILLSLTEICSDKTDPTRCPITLDKQFNFFFLAHELQQVNLAVLFMLNSDMYIEFFYQSEFQRYRGLYLCKIVLYVLMKQAETYL